MNLITKMRLIVATFAMANLFGLMSHASGQTNTFPSTGNVGIGTTTPTNLFHINSGATPSSQFRISANSAGSLSGLAHAPDNVAVGFDTDWNGTGWIARHGTLATLYKNSGKLYVLGASGATVGSPIPVWTTLTSLDLTTGKFGIGIDSPGYRLDVQGGQINSSGGLCIAGDCKTSWSQVGGGGGSQWGGTSGNPIYYTGGNVGIGTNNPTSSLHVYQPSDANLRIETGGGSYGYVQLTTPSSGVGYLIKNTSTANQVQDKSLYLWNSNGVIQFVPGGDPAKAATIDTAGNMTIAGNINAKYQDLAEWVPAAEPLDAGTVVVLDTTKSNQVISSSQSYDTRVAGVISAQPGITLGEGGEGKVLVATTGRVRVRVDASRGPIQIGDLLVTSNVRGVAMKSEVVNLGGVQIHRPGTIIGKALEPLTKGKGEILVLLSLQ